MIPAHLFVNSRADYKTSRPCQKVCEYFTESRIGSVFSSLISIYFPPRYPDYVNLPAGNSINSRVVQSRDVQPISNNLVMHSPNNNDLRKHLLTFLHFAEKTDLAQTSQIWAQSVRGYYEKLIPGMVSNSQGMNIDMFKHVYQKALGPRIYKKVFGNVKPIIPIPRSFVDAASEPDPYLEGKQKKDTFQAVYIPSFITITAEKGSLWTIDKNGNLAWDLELCEDLAEFETTREIRVPVTLNNIIRLLEHRPEADKYLIRYEYGVAGSSHSDVLKQHGDEPVQAHWTYQRRDLTCFWDSYNTQEIVALMYKLEPASLIDRFVYSILAESHLGHYITDNMESARTSTSVFYGEDEGFQHVSIRYSFNPLRTFQFCASNAVFRSWGLAVQLPVKKTLEDNEEKKVPLSDSVSSTEVAQRLDYI